MKPERLEKEGPEGPWISFDFSSPEDGASLEDFVKGMTRSDLCLNRITCCCVGKRPKGNRKAAGVFYEGR